MGNAKPGHTNVDTQIESNIVPSPKIHPRRSLFQHDQHIEQFILIWLDKSSQENSLHSLHTKTLLKQINNDRCLFFDDIDLCLSNIDVLKKENKKMIVVISGSFAKEILSKNKDLPTMIIFCQDYNKYNRLFEKYFNVTDVCTEYETLKNCIQRELPSLKSNLFSHRKLNSLRFISSSENIGYSGAYFSYMLFIDLLKRMPQTQQAKENMLNKCKDYYRKDATELKRIEEFEKTYTSNKAIDWYIEDSFFYRLINKAFRTEDVSLWYLFRFFIFDLCTQLEDIHKKQNNQTCFTVYRGQAFLPTTEFESLKSNIGGLISTNGFFSTSTNFEIAKTFFVGAKDTEDFKVALFKITVDASQLKNIIFVDIDKYMNQIYESEILFSIGSVFKIENVNYDSDLCAWVIKMKATDQETKSIKDRIDTMRTKFQNCNINLLFGRLLLDMAQYSKAESYFKMMLHALPKSHIDLALVYDHIGDLNMQTTNWNEALKNFNLAYEIKKKRRPSNHPDIGTTFNSIGNYYKIIGDNNQALEYYEKALKCKNNQYNTAITLINIGTIHLINKDYGKALELCFEARDILEQIIPCSYGTIIYCQGIIGDIYLALHKYNTAEDFYSAAFEMCNKYLFIDDRRRMKSITALANFYHQQNMTERAIEFCYHHLSFYEQHLGENHTIIAYLLIKIVELYGDDNKQNLKSLVERALSILKENIHDEYATTANCRMMIGEYHQKQNDIETALKYYTEAIEIQKKIYPKDHPLPIKTQNLIKTLVSKD